MGTADKLDVIAEWHLLRRRFRPLDLLVEEIPFQYHLSDGESELCLWHAGRCLFLSRTSECLQVDRSDTDRLW